MDVKKKVNASQSLYISHIEAMQNVVRLHKACSNAGLEEIATVVAANVQSVEEVRRFRNIYCTFYVYSNIMHHHRINDVLACVFLFLVFFNQLLGAESVEANLIFDELHKSLSIQQGELAIFASELRQVWNLYITF